MQPFNLLIKSTDTRTTFYRWQFQFTSYNLKEQLPTRVQTSINVYLRIYIYIYKCGGNPTGRQQRNPIWGLDPASGPHIPSSQPQKPKACLKTCYDAATQAQAEDLRRRMPTWMKTRTLLVLRLQRGQQPQNCPWLCPRSWIPYPLARTASCGWPADKGKPIIFSCNICKSKKLNDTNLNSTTTKTTTYAPKNVSTSHVRMYVSICTWAQDEPSKILQPKRKYPCVCACVFGSCKH